jgi:phenylacetate-coenzyme A ligase PaaK-like adenylate-forming protein
MSRARTRTHMSGSCVTGRNDMLIIRGVNVYPSRGLRRS